MFTAAQLGALIGGVGADEPASIVLQSAFANGTVVKDVNGHDVTSHGFTVKYAAVGGEVIGFADANNDGIRNNGELDVFKISQASNGNITFDLQDQIDHPQASGDGGILELNLSAALLIADNDGDKVPVASGAFTVKVENDIPADTTATITIAVAEDTLSTTSPAPVDFTNGNPDAGSPLTDEALFKNVDLQTLVVPGADEQAIFSLNTAVSGVLLTINGEVVTSHNLNVRLGFDGTNVVGYTNGAGGNNLTYDAGIDNIVFQISAVGNGDFKFDLRDKIDHISDTTGLGGLGDTGTLVLDLSKALLATDFDGDTVNLGLGSIMVSVENDVPVAGVSTVNLDEDGLTGGNLGGPDDYNPASNGPVTVNANLNVNFGADGPGTSAFLLTGFTLPSGFTIDPSSTSSHIVIKQGATAVLELTLTNASTGAYTVTQLHAIDHPTLNDQPGDNTENNLQFTIKYTATDFDGDTSTGSFTIDVDDDTPTISATGTVPSVTDDETYLGTDNTANFGTLFTPHYGADGPGSFTYTLSATAGASGLIDTLTGQVVDLSVVGNQVFGKTHISGLTVFVLSVDVNGVVTLDQQRAVVHGDTSDPDDSTSLSAADLVKLTATITDHDGDSSTYSIDIGKSLIFKDDGPTLNASATPVLLNVDEDGLAGHNADAGRTGETGAVVPSPGAVATGAAGALNALVNFGADGPGANGFHLATVGTPVDSGFKSNGQTIWIVSDGTTLHGYVEVGGGAGFQGANDRDVFTLTVGQNGSYTFTLKDQIDHPTLDGQSGDNSENLLGDKLIDLSGYIVATDGDGDSVTLGSGTFKIDVRDDIPVTASNALVRADEDDIPVIGNNDTTSPGDDVSGSLTGTLQFSVGADEPGSVGFASLNGGAVLDSNGVAVTAGNVALHYYWDSATNTLYASKIADAANAASTAAFKIQVNPTTGDYTFTLVGQVDHPGHDDLSTTGTVETAYEDNLTINLTYSVTDKDGDTATGTLSVNIDDDMPILAASPTNLIANGDFSQGTFAPAGFGGVAQPNGLTGWVVANSTFEPPASGGLQVEKVTDGYLGMHTSTHGEMIDMGASPGNIQISQQLSGLTPGQTYAIEFEAGAPYPSTAELEIVWGNTVIGTIDPAGPMTSYAFVVTATGIAANDQITFREVGHGHAPLPGAADEGYHGTYLANVAIVATNTVDEDGLNGPLSFGNHDSQVGDAVVGNSDNDNNEATATGNLNIKWGADNVDTADTTGGTFGTLLQDTPTTGNRSVAFTDANVGFAGGTSFAALTSQGETIHFSLNADKTILTATAGTRTVFEVSLSDDGTGSYRFVLLDQLDHAPNANENDIALTFGYTAKDSDGDAVNGKFIVSVDDDIPTTASNSLVVANEDDLSGGNAGGPGNDVSANLTGTLHFSVGADEPPVVGFASLGGGNVTDTGNAAVTVNGAALKYFWDAGSNTLYASTDTSSLPNAQSTAAFKVEITDTATGAYKFTLLHAIDHPGHDNPATTGTVETAFEDNININLTYTVTDKDGDATTGTLAVSIDDDTPTIGTASGTVVESTVNTLLSNAFVEASTTGTLAISWGADNANPNSGTHDRSVAFDAALNGVQAGLTSNGDAITYALSANNTVLTATATHNAVERIIFTVSIDDLVNGNYTFTLKDNIDHAPPASGADKNDKALSFGFAATDSDGDTVTGSLTIHVTDDIPTVGAAVSGTVVEHGLPILALGLQSINGNLNIDWNADDKGTHHLEFAKDSGGKPLGIPAGLTSGGAPLDYLIQHDINGNERLVVFKAGEVDPTNHPVFVVDLASNSSYVFTLFQPLDHVSPNGASQPLAFTINAIDGDGDTVQQSLTINVTDDTPSIATTGTLTPITDDETFLAVDHTGSFASNFTSSFGADGPGTLTYALGISAPGADSGLVDTATGHHVFLFLVGTAVVGREGTDAANALASGHIVFTASVDGNGVVTLDQQRAIVHTPDSGPDQATSLSAASLITLTATITDKDGDSASAVQNIGQSLVFRDDAPTIVTTGTLSAITDDETALGTNSTGSFAANFSSSYGNDGAGTLAYAVGVSASGVDSGLIDTATNNHVFLFVESGQVVGRAGANSGAAAGGPIVFTASVDSNGVVTLDQQRAVVHSPNTGPDQSTSLSAANLITLTATITDKDGDSASAVQNIGQSLVFRDDAPTIVTTGTLSAITDDETALGTNNTGSFAANFSSSYGADGAGTLAYAVGVSASGVDSGLIDTATNNHVFLFVESGQVVGRAGANSGAAAGGPIVFTASVDSNGVVTLDQQRAVVHSPNTGPDQSTSLSAANLITLTATITDKDGDSASAVQNIGTSLVFKDDAPTAPSLSPAVAGVAHDETVGVQTSADPNAAQDVAANSAGFGSFATVADIFTAVPSQGDDLDVAGTGPIGYAASAGSLVTLSGGSFGNDGAAASNSTTYALVVTDGAPSGVSTTGGTQIFLYNGGNGLILGRVGTEAGATDTANASGTVAFALATDPATGKVYVAQYLSLAHGTAGSNAAAYDESISLTLASLGMKVTYTDKDGDAATSTTVNIGNLVSFQDDGPSAGNDTIGTAITGTFTTGNLLSNDSYGVDGAASTGSVTATNGAHGTVVYNNNGTFTYTPNAGYNGSDSFTYIIKDGDGDTSTATVTLQSIQTNTLPTAGTQSITVDEDGLTNGITASQPGDVAGAAITQTGTLVFNFNADGPAATDPINFSPMHNTSVGLSSGGAALTYYWDSTGDTLYASTNTSSLANAQSSAVFKVVLNTTTGVYTFTELKPVDHPGHDADGLNNGPETSYEDNVVVNLTYQVKDSNGDAATGTLAVTINDDSPTAAPDTGSANEKVAQTIHAAFVLDFSGSIDSTEFAQMMTAVKAAGDKIFQNSTGGTSVELVAFASSSIASGPFLTQAAFDAQMDAWTSSRPLSSNTNYTSAISTLLANYSSVAGQNNQVFFVSDGNPNEGTGSGGDVLSEPTKTNWSNFVNGATQVHVTSIGVGDGIDNASLQQIDVDGQGTVIAVAQFSDLIDTITALIGTDATGNVLTNDGFGADGGRLLSITIDNVEYTFNGTNHVTATSGSAPASFVDHGTWMEVGTQLQGKITFYFATTGSHQAGEWNYSAPNELAADTSENISYAIRDNDGDKVTSTLTISVLAQNDAPVISLNTTPVTLHATDNFAAQSYSGGSGWAGNWTETNEFTGTNPTADDIQIVADGSGNFSLRLSDDIGDSDSENPGDTVQRTVNLTGATSATLEFDYKRSNMTGSDDQVFVQVSKDGVNYTTVLTIDQNSPTSSTHFSVDISAYISSGTSIRFVAPDGLEADDFAFVDNIDVSYSVPGHVAYTENAAAVKIMPAATLADPDNPSNFNGGSLHVQLTAGSVAGDALAFTGVGATQSSGNVIVGGTTIGTVTGYGTADMTISFNTNATDARIETLMQAIGFSSTSDNPGTSRTVTVTFNDGGNTGAGGPLSDVKTVTIDVTQINDAPVANNDTGQATEAGGTANGTAGSNATGNVLTNDTDPDSTLTVASFRTGGTEGSGTAGVVGGAALTGAHGTLTLGANGAYTYAVNENDAAVQALNVGGTTTDTFNYTVTDGSSTDIATLTITINGANDAPTTDLNGGTAGTNSSAAFTEGTAVLIAPSATVADVDNANLASMTATLTNRLDGNALESLSLNSSATAAAAGLTVSYTAATGVLSITGSASKATYQTILDGILYNNTSDNPTTTSRSVTVVVSDGGLSSASNTATISVTAVNDAPTGPASLTLLSNTGSGAVTVTEAAFAAYGADVDNTTLGVGTLAGSTGLQSLTNSGLGNANVGTVGTITVDDDGTLGGSFTFTITDGTAQSSPATAVTFTNNSTGTTSLTAGSADTIIVNSQNAASTLTGGTGKDYIIGNAQSDIIVGAQNDIVLDGGAGTDTLRIGANFTSTSNAQIVNIENIELTAAVSVDLSNQTENFTITGSAGADSIKSGSGNDTIIGAQNDTLLDGGGGTDTLQIGAAFTSTSDAQISNIENVTLTAAATVDLSNQTEDFTITGSAGIDSIKAGSGDDIIVGAVNDTLLDGGGGADTLQIGANFTSTGNAQIANIETIELTAAVTLNLSNQSEGFKIIGSSGVDTITGGGGADIINAGGGNDTVTGGGGADQFRLATNTGTDIIKDYTDGTDKIGFLDNGATGSGSVNFVNTAGSAAGTALNASDFLTLSTISAMSNSNDDKIISITTGQSTATITGTTIGGSGSPDDNYIIVFNTTTSRGEIWYDTDWSDTGNRVQVATLDNITTLAQLTAITASDVVVYNSATDPLVLDLGQAGVQLSGVDQGVTFDINGDGVKEQVAWTANGEDGILALDVDGSGKIENGNELFTPTFAGGKFANGLAALASLDSNHDGVISSQDQAFDKLVVWQDANHNGVSDQGELTKLGDLGIKSIDLGATASTETINEQQVEAKGSFTYTDGSKGTFIEVNFETSAEGSATSATGASHHEESRVHDQQPPVGGNAPAISHEAVASILADFQHHEESHIDLSALGHPGDQGGATPAGGEHTTCAGYAPVPAAVLIAQEQAALAAATATH